MPRAKKKHPAWLVALNAVHGVLFMFALGLVAIWIGVGELQTLSGSSAEPTLTSLEDIEAGKPLANYNVRIGPHFLLYPLAVFSYTGLPFTGEPSPGTAVKETFVPAVSETHPYIESLRRLETMYGSLDKVPRSVRFPEVGTYSLIVRTEAFRTVGEIPDGIEHHDEAAGLIRNKIEPLFPDERELLTKANPELDAESVLVLDSGRELPSPRGSYVTIAGGAALILFAAYRLTTFVRKHRRSESPYRSPTPPVR